MFKEKIVHLQSLWGYLKSVSFYIVLRHFVYQLKNSKNASRLEPKQTEERDFLKLVYGKLLL